MTDDATDEFEVLLEEARDRIAQTGVADDRPPHNIEAERAVLGAVLLSDTAMHALVKTGLQPEDFYRQPFGLLWRAMGELHRSGRGIDHLVLSEFLRQTGRLDSVGGPQAIEMLAGSVPSVSNAAEYARIVRKCALWRRRLHATHRMRQAVAQLNEEAWQEAWEEVAP